MADRTLPRYPVYIPTKGRHSWPLTARFLSADGVPYHAVVEREEAEAYAAAIGADRLLVLPESGRGLLYARNWIRDHAEAGGHARHWQIDDNIHRIRRQYRGRLIPCDSGVALRVMEDFCDRYDNIALAGPHYEFYVRGARRPFVRNVHVYSCTLVNHACPCRWRLVYNDDTDLCLQVLSAGWCTVGFYAYVTGKAQTMSLRGGNTDDLYAGDGRLRMARSLERVWPGVVRVDRRWKRPQHVVNWSKFDTPLHLKPGVDLDGMTPNEYGMRLEAARPVAGPLADVQASHAALLTNDG